MDLKDRAVLEPAWAQQPYPAHVRFQVYLVGGVAVPDDEFPILGSTDQQPAAVVGGRQRDQGMKALIYREGPSMPSHGKNSSPQKANTVARIFP